MIVVEVCFLRNRLVYVESGYGAVRVAGGEFNGRVKRVKEV